MNIEKLRSILNKEAEKNINNLSCEKVLKISKELDKIMSYSLKNNCKSLN